MVKALLLDLGNSRLKWAIDAGVERRMGEPIAHGESGLGQLAPLIEAARATESAWISSTAHTLTRELLDALALHFGFRCQLFASPKEGLGIRSAYDAPQSLGTDRFLAMAGARAQVEGPFLLVDCGTALTVDFVDEGGQHLGGLIAPGPMLMRQALFGGTDGLRPGQAPRLREFARNTDDAIWSGGCHACAALVGHAWRHASMSAGQEVELLLTGGGVAAFESLLNLPHRRLANPVLDGLALWARGG